MGVQRRGTRARERTTSAGGSAVGAVWLDYSSSTVTLHTEHRTSTGSGSGAVNWERCDKPDCLGSKLPNATTCLLHANGQDRTSHYRQVSSTGAPLILSGVVIDAMLWQEAMSAVSAHERVRPPIQCLGAVFPFQIRGTGVMFSQNVTLTGAILEKGMQLHSCEFKSGLQMDFVDFDDSVAFLKECSFDSDVSSRYGHMEENRQHLAFAACRISGNAVMPGFVGDLRFDECSIEGSLDVANAKLSHLSMADLHLRRQFEAHDLEAPFVRSSNANFGGAIAVGPISARVSDFSRSVFVTRTQVILKGERADFRGTTWPMGGRLEVEDANLDLGSAALGGTLTIVGSGSASISSIRDADAGLLAMSTLDLSRCVFRGAHRLQEMSIDSTLNLPLAPSHPLRARRRRVADEFSWRGRHTRWRKRDWTIPGTVLDVPDPKTADATVLPDLQPAEIAGVYRALRRALESGANEPGASDFYYGEMEMRRVDTTNSWAERIVVALYWIIAGYGLRATRALGWLVVTLAIGSILQLRVGIEKPKNPSIVESVLTVIEGALPGVSTTTTLNTWGRVIDLALTIVGPVLLGLAALSLRNRVKR